MSAPQPIDVLHLGRPRVICCHRVGDDLIDPGPTASLDAVLDALDGDVPRRLLLTHIHLDHAGAAGTLVQRFPDLEVWVSEVGAKHVVDPSRLVDSATRLYGEDMDRLWGDILPVPAENVRALTGDEVIGEWRVAATPGHAKHHVSYLHEDHGWAFAGDVAGVRVVPGLITPPTPPPDIDLEAWDASIDVLQAWAPTTLALTNFGPYEDVAWHLDRIRDTLGRWSDLSRVTDEAGYSAALRATMSSAGDRELQEAMAGALPPGQQWAGLQRYWAKRAEREAAEAGAG
jgi:glyoxylase-like metal-dependent hydrolase (beta-lactamase superfamily II)